MFAQRAFSAKKQGSQQTAETVITHVLMERRLVRICSIDWTPLGRVQGVAAKG